MTRREAARQSAALLRLEALHSSPEVRALLAAWAAGEIDDDALIAAERCILRNS